MTSAHTIHYTIRNSSGEAVGEHSWNFYCNTRWGELRKFIPLDEHTIQAWWYDEEDEYHEDEPENLKTFFLKLKLPS